MPSPLQITPTKFVFSVQGKNYKWRLPLPTGLSNSTIKAVFTGYDINNPTNWWSETIYLSAVGDSGSGYTVTYIDSRSDPGGAVGWSVLVQPLNTDVFFYTDDGTGDARWIVVVEVDSVVLP